MITMRKKTTKWKIFISCIVYAFLCSITKFIPITVGVDGSVREEALPDCDNNPRSCPDWMYCAEEQNLCRSCGPCLENAIAVDPFCKHSAFRCAASLMNFNIPHCPWPVDQSGGSCQAVCRPRRLPRGGATIGTVCTMSCSSTDQNLKSSQSQPSVNITCIFNRTGQWQGQIPDWIGFEQFSTSKAPTTTTATSTTTTTTTTNRTSPASVQSEINQTDNMTAIIQPSREFLVNDVKLIVIISVSVAMTVIIMVVIIGVVFCIRLIMKKVFFDEPDQNDEQRTDAAETLLNSPPVPSPSPSSSSENSGIRNENDQDPNNSPPTLHAHLPPPPPSSHSAGSPFTSSHHPPPSFSRGRSGEEVECTPPSSHDHRQDNVDLQQPIPKKIAEEIDYVELSVENPQPSEPHIHHQSFRNNQPSYHSNDQSRHQSRHGNSSRDPRLTSRDRYDKSWPNGEPQSLISLHSCSTNYSLGDDTFCSLCADDNSEEQLSLVICKQPQYKHTPGMTYARDTAVMNNHVRDYDTMNRPMGGGIMNRDAIWSHDVTRNGRHEVTGNGSNSRRHDTLSYDFNGRRHSVVTSVHVPMVVHGEQTGNSYNAHEDLSRKETQVKTLR